MAAGPLSSPVPMQSLRSPGRCLRSPIHSMQPRMSNVNSRTSSAHAASAAAAHQSIEPGLLRPVPEYELQQQQVFEQEEYQMSRWRKDFVLSVGREVSAKFEDLRQARRELSDLQTDLESIKESLEATRKLTVHGKRTAQALEASENSARERAHAIELAHAELQRQEQKHEQELREASRRSAAQTQEAKERHEEASKLISTYQHRLGLTIAREAPQTVKVSFAFLDKADPFREFSFILEASSSADGASSASFRVSDVTPEVPKVRELLLELNEGRNTRAALPRFLCSMRKAFQEVTNRTD